MRARQGETGTVGATILFLVFGYRPNEAVSVHPARGLCQGLSIHRDGYGSAVPVSMCSSIHWPILDLVR